MLPKIYGEKFDISGEIKVKHIVHHAEDLPPLIDASVQRELPAPSPEFED